MNNTGHVKEDKKLFSGIGIAFLVCFIVIVIARAVLIVLAKNIIPAEKYESMKLTINMIVSVISQYILAYSVLLIMLSRIKAEKPVPKNVGADGILKAFICSMPTAFFGNLLGKYLSALLSSGKAENHISDIVGSMNPFVIFMTVVLAPVFEELIFRKFIMDRISQYGEFAAILFSSLCFAVFHMNLYQFFYTFGFGVVLGYLYVRTGRILFAIITHSLFNLNGSVISVWAVGQLDKDKYKTFIEGGGRDHKLLEEILPGLAVYFSYLIVYIGLVAAGIVIIINVINSKPAFEKREKELPKGTTAAVMLCNPGMIAFLVVSAAVTLLPVLFAA